MRDELGEDFLGREEEVGGRGARGVVGRGGREEELVDGEAEVEEGEERREGRCSDQSEEMEGAVRFP